MRSRAAIPEIWFFLLIWYLAAVNMEETAGNSTANANAAAADPATTPTTTSTTTTTTSTTTTTPLLLPVLPSFYEEGPQLQIYRPETEYVLLCDAVGRPKPSYEWYKDGHSLTTLPENVAMYPEESGSLYFSYVRPEDEGYYQCFASNPHGRVASQITHLKQAKLKPYPQMATKMYIGRVGERLKLSCQATLSVPEATYSWSLSSGPADTFPQQLRLSSRRTIDEHGNLYFAHLYGTEEQDGSLYRCKASNPYLWIDTAGSDSEIMFVDEGEGADSAPQLFFSSDSPKVILLNSDATLRCFFSGKPTPKVSWHRQGLPLPYRRSQETMFGTGLEISQVQAEDAGNYECVATNDYGQVTNHTITVVVQSKPFFPSNKELPHDTFRQRGTAKFSCEPTADPPASIQWYINGEPVNRDSVGDRRHISEDDRHLTVTDVCRECLDGESDLMVVQCNASNIHGYSLSTGSLNIIECENEAEYDSFICERPVAEVGDGSSASSNNNKASTNISKLSSVLVISSVLMTFIVTCHSHLASV